ncbi:MAG: hypothetical protein KAT77_04345 [Nanoarchaeota archaeon]|nr:hypothetical protein [Nanoarchaeota archaeon]
MKLVNKLRFYRDSNPLRFFGSMGIFFIVLGFLTGLWLVFLFLATGRVGHIPATILTMLFFLTGVQVLCFAFLADMKRGVKYEN